ncbi:glycosyltransferase family 2 protein [Leptolyngbya sp. FACHB-261]|uniref:glycosyltransferase family 2 protein n=1 Tax=Leptolyngbya sp. FACHB-261 TaxID=2692806 RepID=UPI001681ED23|nr:glycosyltransferase family 2 protein [Leptolyngbya sp. FACHB-261]MBD2101128.1 glycosyltransferase family 2 protein [Leptolyngbya sp. FACHB-261]
MDSSPNEQNSPAVSIVIPLYNKGKYIARGLNSILAQTYKNFEIIVVDDGSTDQGPSIVSSYTDPRVKLIYQANAGPGAARNRGIAESTAPLLSFLDADDEWAPELLERSIQHLQDHPDCALTVLGRYLGAERTSWELEAQRFGITRGPWRLPTRMDARLMKRAIDFFHPGAVVCRREVLERFGGFYAKDRCNYGEDVYLWVQIILNYKIYRDPAPLFWWHTEASEISAHSSRKILPPWPMLSDPEPLRKDCPAEYRTLLEQFLAYLALVAALRCINSDDSKTAHQLLKQYPLVRSLRRDYLGAQLDILLTSWPGLRGLIRRVASLVPS